MVEITYMIIALKFLFRVLSTINEYILSYSLLWPKTLSCVEQLSRSRHLL